MKKTLALILILAMTAMTFISCIGKTTTVTREEWENAFDFSEEEASVDDMSHDDLLALLGGLDVNGEPEEVGLFSEQEEMQGETFQGDEINDLLSGVAVAERAKERKERKKKIVLFNNFIKIKIIRQIKLINT